MKRQTKRKTTEWCDSPTQQQPPSSPEKKQQRTSIQDAILPFNSDIPPPPPSSPPPPPPPPSSSPPPPPPPPPPTSEEETALLEAMGLPVSFDTTKGKQVQGNDVGAANIKHKRVYRQYMNRPGGFNRPLDSVP
ncbi:U4/U6.U5 small nuclear ribonucleoprotein 27 kDa protein [Galdieria sulphuraria]|nr:U4/U6.U5 small nuclear ribonucleoprotein 27 kDa protein [Galdieria sulphuraria]